MGRSHAERFITPVSLSLSLSERTAAGAEQASRPNTREREQPAPCRNRRIRLAGGRASTPPRLRLIPLRPSADTKPSTHSDSAGLQPSKQREPLSEISTTWKTCRSRVPRPTKPTRRRHHRSQPPRRLPNNNSNAARQTATQRPRPSSQRRNARRSNRNTKPGPRTSFRTQRPSTSGTASRKGSSRIGEPSSSQRGNAASAPPPPNKVSSGPPSWPFVGLGENSTGILTVYSRLLGHPGGNNTILYSRVAG